MAPVVDAGGGVSDRRGAGPGAGCDELRRVTHPRTGVDRVFRTFTLPFPRSAPRLRERAGRSDYFLDSAARCHFFGEKDAVDERGELREEYRGAHHKMAALNKAGHGLHLPPGPFRSYATSHKVAGLLRELGWTDPVVPQSMYI